MSSSSSNTKLLGALMLLIPVLVCITWVNYYYLFRLEKTYSALLKETIQNNNTVTQTLANQGIILNKLLLMSASSSNKPMLLKISHEIDSISDLNTTFFKALAFHARKNNSLTSFQKIRSLREIYLKERALYIHLLLHGRSTEARTLLERKLSTHLVNYFILQQRFIEHIGVQINNSSSQIATETENILRINRILAILPVVLLLAGLTFIGIVLFRLLKIEDDHSPNSNSAE